MSEVSHTRNASATVGNLPPPPVPSAPRSTSQPQLPSTKIPLTSKKDWQQQQQHPPSDLEIMHRRSGIRRGTLLVSRFLHKISNLIHNKVESSQNREQIESMKLRLNKEGSTYIQPENKPLQWGFLDYIQDIFGIGKAACEKRQQISYSWRKIKERLNAVHILQKLVELEKLKILLLDENQLKLFDYLPKPLIQLNPTTNDLPGGNVNGGACVSLSSNKATPLPIVAAATTTTTTVNH